MVLSQGNINECRNMYYDYREKYTNKNSLYSKLYKSFLYIFVIFIFLQISSFQSLFAQPAVLYFEDFESYTGGEQTGTGSPPDWTTIPSGNGNFSVVDNGNKEFYCNFVQSLAVWETKFVDISAYSNIFISVDIKDNNSGLDPTIDTITLY